VAKFLTTEFIHLNCVREMEVIALVSIPDWRYEADCHTSATGDRLQNT